MLTFDFSKYTTSIINKLWDDREGGTAGYVFGPIEQPRGMSFIDINGDGLKDLFLMPGYYNYDPACPLIYALNEGGQFSTFKTIELPIDSAGGSNGIFHFMWKDASYVLIIDQGLETGGLGNYPGSKNWLFKYDSATQTLVDQTSLLPSNNYIAFNHIAQIGDINNDGNIDVLFSRMSGDNFTTDGAIWWSFQNTVVNRSSELPKQIAESTNRWSTNGSAVIQNNIGSINYADFDGNGKADILSLGYNAKDSDNSASSVRIYFDGKNTPTIITRDDGTMGGAADSAVGDIDNDGDADIVLLWESTPGQSLQVLINNGNKTFSDKTADWLPGMNKRDGSTTDAEGNYESGLSRVTLNDTDGDGHLDILLRTFKVSGTGFTGSNADQSFLYQNTGTRFAPYDFSLIEADMELLYGTTELRSWSTGYPFLTDITGDGVVDLVFIKAAETFVDVSGEKYSTHYQIVSIPGTASGTLAGDNKFSGSFDADVLAGSTGNDTLIGGFGNDIALFPGLVENYTIAKMLEGYSVTDHVGNEGVDTLLAIEQIQFADKVVLLPEEIMGTSGNDKLTVGNSGYIISAGEGNNTITCGGGNDQVTAGSGIDRVIDTGGDNTIDAGAGNNTVTTGAGADIIITGKGTDKIAAGDGNNTITGGDGNKTITSGAGNDQITVGKGTNKITAGDGANQIMAGDGINTITTGSGNDSVTAGAGKDIIKSGDGDDWIDGGFGTNSITTGLGADTIVLGAVVAKGNLCNITDFSAEDTLELKLSIFTMLATHSADNLAIDKKRADLDTNDYLIYDSKTGKLYYDEDGSEATFKAVQIAGIKGTGAKTLSIDDLGFA